MSLQLIAKQMEAKGRKGDSMLVHMTPSEVAGLQKLAESAGGSLSVNPETGLVEANFLKRMLPTLVGVGVGMFAGPMAGAAAGALVGGATAPKDQREMGILMGALGGYGGAGIGAGLGAAGSTAAQAAAMNTAATAGQAANLGTAAGVGSSALPSGLIGAGAEGVAGEAIAQEAANAALQQELKTQAINQAAEAEAKRFAAQGIGARTGQGISALMDQSTNVGRDAFLSKVGMKELGMAAAPMMMDDRRQAEVPVDDEMYSYTYDVGRTGAENTPSGSSAERRYFDGRFSPVRKIRARDYAAQGGLMSLAEGGETAAPTAAEVAAPTASEAALAYLMGERSSSAPARAPLIDAQLMEGVRPVPKPVVGGDNMYAFDPATGTFLRNPNIPGASTSGSPVGTSFSDSGGSYDAPMSQQTIDFFDRETPAQRDARMGEVSNLFSLGPVGAFVNAVTGSGLPGRAPNFGTLFGTGDAYNSLGNTPSNQSYNAPGNDSMDFGYSPSDSGGGGGNVDPGGYAGYDSGRPDFAAGGILGLAKGGMKSGGFVVPADVVSMIGEGNTDAGYSRIKSMVPGATAIKGKDGGQADTVKTSIEGKQPARVAHGEMYIPPETVKRMGGAKKLYAMMDRVRQQATGSRKQIKPVSLKQAMA
jgi:hypothetical protein